MLYAFSKEQFMTVKDSTRQEITEFLTFINFLKRKNELDAIRIKKAYK